MNKKLGLLALTLVVIFVVSFFTILVNKKDYTYKPGISVEFDRAVNQAQTVYRQKKNLGQNFEAGPCLTNDLMTGWVADIVHNPRQSIDNNPQNECQAYLEGRASHFVELDLDGNVVRVQ